MITNHPINIALTGDSIIARRISAHQDDPTKKLYSHLQDADVAFTNLEVLPNDFQGYPAARSDGAHFAAHSYVLDDLTNIGFNLMSCANNHALDYGVEGLLAMMKELDKRGIAYSGVGTNLTQARMPVYYDTPNGTVALISCTATFFEEQSAGEARPEVQGRPGVNPLRYNVQYEVKEEQMKVLRELQQEWGFQQQIMDYIKLGFVKMPSNVNLNDTTILVDLNHRVAGTFFAQIKVSDKTQIRTKPNAVDMKEIAKWIREAKGRADVVMVSLHAHEQSGSRELPAEFIEAFARGVIDEGADMMIGHGPHLLRGMEIYNGKPIFYSLGNFIGQNELIYKVPADTYKLFMVDPAMTPSEIFRSRSDNGTKGFPADPVYWETVVPICRFSEGKLVHLEIVPVSLTRGSEPHHRGRPYLAEGEDAKGILERFAELSKPYGTTIAIDDTGSGVVQLRANS